MEVILKVYSPNTYYGSKNTSYKIAIRWMPQNTFDDKSTLTQVIAWCRQATSYYLSQCWYRSMLPYGITRPQWVNSLRPSDAIWRQRSGSTLAQVMACCLTAPSHYLNQCWFIISKVLWHPSEDNFVRDTPARFTKISLKITYLKLNWNFPGANELTRLFPNLLTQS